MESGVKYEYVGPNSEFSRHIQSIGPEARALKVPVGNYSFLATLDRKRNHGDRMSYKEADPLALAWAAEKRTGKRFADLLHERVWARMGAEFDADATCDPLCQWTFYLSVTLRDLARWGLMCLNNGTLNGKQIVPASFFEDIRANASVEKLSKAPLLGNFMPEGIGYRSFFYHHQESDAIAAVGGLGQFCYINRKHRTVVAFFSTTPPWAAAEATPEDFEEEDAFQRECRLERERWHLCHEIAKASG
jgi:CubicO group peptidase (beta-lactamase class C family)